MQTTFKILVSCLFCFALFFVSGCGDSQHPSKLVGKWECPNGVVELCKDGTVNAPSGEKGVWRVENGRLHLSGASLPPLATDYTISGSTLTVVSEDNKTIEHKRVK